LLLQELTTPFISFPQIPIKIYLEAVFTTLNLKEQIPEFGSV